MKNEVLVACAPLVLEPELNARATVRLGAGASTSPVRGETLAAALSGFLQSDACADAARGFAARYAQHCPQGGMHSGRG